jgi:hypothetical protein
MFVFKVGIYPHKITIVITILYGFHKVCQQENSLQSVRGSRLEAGRKRELQIVNAKSA